MADERPTILANDLNRGTDQAWRILEQANCETASAEFVFLYGGQPSRFEHNDNNRLVPRTLTPDRMRHRLSRIAVWEKAQKEGKKVRQPGAPMEIVKNVLATPDPPLPVVARIVEVPVLDRDGRIHDRPGYGANARVFYEPAAELIVPKVRNVPTKQDRRRALSLLQDELLSDFPFVGEAEKAHALALALQPFVRDLIDGPTPLFLVEAPTPGTGKGLLVQAACWPAVGATTPPMAEGGDEDEWRKRITAALIEAPPAVLIDNVQDRLDSASLSAALTTTDWKDRRLGQSEMLTLPNRATWIATGNNPSLSGEIMRRSIRIRLDSHMESPEDRRDFRHSNLLEWVSRSRGELVWAALTLAKAWDAAGRPKGNRSLGSFESWATVLGGILGHAEVPGFLGNLEQLREHAGSERDDVYAFLHDWHTMLDGTPVKANSLPAHLLERVGDLTPKQLGLYLRRQTDRRYGDLILRASSKRDGVQLWAVEEIGEE